MAPPQPVDVRADNGIVDLAGDAIDKVDVGEGVGDDLVWALVGSHGGQGGDKTNSPSQSPQPPTPTQTASPSASAAAQSA